MSPYQPVIRDGKVIAGGERDCADRYDLIYRHLARPPGEELEYAGGFSLLDIGAYTGYFSVRARQDFNARVTAIDDNPDLSAIADDRTKVINRRVSAQYLRDLPRHDVVLALSVLHHMVDWKQALRWIQACRYGAFIEVCHPSEKWMRKAAARHQVREIHQAVSAIGEQVGSSPRTGRDGKTYQRPMFYVPGNIITWTGTVFGGSGSCSRLLPQFSRGLDKHLGYTPFPGSMNLRIDGNNKLMGPPEVPWVGRRASPPRRRDYQFWSAWLNDYPCHAMIPGRRGWGPDSIEMVAPVKLRDAMDIGDGARVTVEVRAN